MLLCSEKIKHEFIYVDTRTQIRVYIYILYFTYSKSCIAGNEMMVRIDFQTFITGSTISFDSQGMEEVFQDVLKHTNP